MAATKVMTFGGLEEESSAPSPFLAEKKKEKRWTRDTDLGRYMLACRCPVPTSFIQSLDGKVRSAPRKGSTAINRKGLPAASRGKTIKVNEAFVKAVLLHLAMWDDGTKLVFPGNSYIELTTGVKIGSVVHALRALSQAGFLRKTSRGFKKAKNCWLDWDRIQYGAGYRLTEETAAPKPVEVDPVLDELLDLMMKRCAGLGPIGEALTRKAAQPVVKSLRKKHEDETIRWAILGLQNFQWKLVVEADVPAAYLRKTLNNALAGLTPDQAMGIGPFPTEAAEPVECSPVPARDYTPSRRKGHHSVAQSRRSPEPVLTEEEEEQAEDERRQAIEDAEEAEHDRLLREAEDEESQPF